MDPKKLHKGLALVTLVAVAIGGVALVTGGGGTNGGFGAPVQDQFAVTEAAAGSAGEASVQSQIDKALGRTTAIEPAAPALGKNGTQSQPGALELKPAPSSRDSAGASAANTAPFAASAPPVPGAPADAMSSAADRKIVQTASIRLQVKQVGSGFEEVGRIASGAGGFIASSNFSYQGEQQVASTTIRVPSARYQEVLGQLRGLGVKVDSESSNASDVTEDYSDLTARLRNLEATETQLLGFLAQTKTVSEVLQVQDRLNNVRNDIERTKGRMNLLDKLSDLSTITVHLRPVVAGSGSSQPGTGLGAELTKAWEDSLEFLGGIATGVLTAIVFVWWLPILLVPAYALWLRFSRRGFSQAEVAARD